MTWKGENLWFNRQLKDVILRLVRKGNLWSLIESLKKVTTQWISKLCHIFWVDMHLVLVVYSNTLYCKLELPHLRPLPWHLSTIMDKCSWNKWMSHTFCELISIQARKENEIPSYPTKWSLLGFTIHPILFWNEVLLGEG